MIDKYFNEKEAINMLYKQAARSIRLVKKTKNYDFAVSLEYHLQGMNDVFLHAFKENFVFHKGHSIIRAYRKLVYKILSIRKTNRKEIKQ